MSRPDAYRPGALLQVNQRYDAFLAAGFPVTFGDEAESLQCRNELDRTNWLTLMGLCEEAIAAVQGDEPIAIPFRTTSNRFYVVSYSDALAILRDLRAWAALAQANWWRLKDALRDAETRQALLAIDLDEGWP